MDNLTHTLVGLAAAKAGLERTSPYATAVCVVAANLPDIDIATLFADNWTYLHHHRGITHSAVGVLSLAVLLPLLFYGGDRLIARLKRRPPRARLGGLLLSSLILSASHPLMDWTNNYGVRPLLPWDARWFYGDLVFILDPWLWLTIGGAAFLLTAKTKARVVVWTVLAVILTTAILFLPQRAGMAIPLAARVLWLASIAGLIAAHRARLATRVGSPVAVVALSLVVVYWGALAVVHARAVSQARRIADSAASARGEKLIRVAAMPTLANPLRWRCVAETDRALTRFDIRVNDEFEAVESDQTGAGVSANDGVAKFAANVFRFEKPQGSDDELTARAIAEDRGASVFSGFARFPAVKVERGCAEEVLVRFADLRFAEPGRAGSASGFAVDVPLKIRNEE